MLAVRQPGHQRAIQRRQRRHQPGNRLRVPAVGRRNPAPADARDPRSPSKTLPPVGPASRRPLGRRTGGTPAPLVDREICAGHEDLQRLFPSAGWRPQPNLEPTAGSAPGMNARADERRPVNRARAGARPLQGASPLSRAIHRPVETARRPRADVRRPTGRRARGYGGPGGGSLRARAGDRPRRPPGPGNTGSQALPSSHRRISWRRTRILGNRKTEPEARSADAALFGGSSSP